jgi:hypothetical protein
MCFTLEPVIVFFVGIVFASFCTLQLAAGAIFEAKKFGRRGENLMNIS